MENCETEDNEELALPVRFEEIYALSRELAKVESETPTSSDMDWKKVLNDPVMAPEARRAYQKEIISLTETHKVLLELSPDHPEYETALKEAISGRAIYGEGKCRCVQHGFKGKAKDLASRPEGCVYTAHVVSHTSVRIAVANHKR
jgi:hypothetical protein